MNQEEIEYILKKAFPLARFEVSIDDHYLGKRLLYASITIRTDLVKAITDRRPSHTLTASEYLKRKGQQSDNRKVVELTTKLLRAIIIPGLKPCIEKGPIVIVLTMEGVAV